MVWNHTDEVLSRVPLERTYPRLRDFFVNTLQVQTMSADLLIQELKVAVDSVGSGTVMKNEQLTQIKKLMIGLGRTLASDPEDTVSKENIQALRKTAFIPVQCNGEPVQLARINGEFFINDHERFGNAFGGKVRMADFTFSDSTSLQPLWALFDLEHRYLSAHVEMMTVVNSSVESRELTEHFRARSYALSCCANSRRSMKYFNQNTEVHLLLMNARLYVSEDMWTKLIVRNAETSVEAQSDRSLAKIEHKEEGIVLYVPDHPSGLYSCYRTELPSIIAKLLAIENGRAEKCIYRILNDELMPLADIMKDEDISHCSWFEKPAVSEQASLNQLTLTAEDWESTPSAQQRTGQVLVSNRHDVSEEPDPPLNDDRFTPEPPQGFLSAPSTLQRVVQDSLYRKVLENVVKQARKISRHSGENELSLEEISVALDDIDRSPDDISLQDAFSLNGHGDTRLPRMLK